MTVDTLGRAYGLYRRTAASRSAIILLIANAIPVIGVLFFGWSLLTILVLYWIENGIIGFWNVPKIAMAQGSIIPKLPDLPNAAARAATGTPEQAAALQEAWRKAQAAQQAQIEQASGAQSTTPPGSAVGIRGIDNPFSKLTAVPRTGLAIFFLVHYGIFWLVHGIFVFALPAFGGFASNGNSSFGEVRWGAVALAAVALFISHGASFLFNYIGRGEYLTTSPTRQMGAPYARVIVLHMTIIFGSMIVAFLGAPIGALLVLVGLKTAFDLGLHLREHRAADARLPGALREPA